MSNTGILSRPIRGRRQVQMTLKARLSGVIGFLSMIMFAIGALGLYGMSRTTEGLRTVYEDRTVALEQVSRIDGLLVRNRLALNEVLYETDGKIIKNHTDLIEKNIAEIVKTWDEYAATYLTPEEKIAADKFAIDRTKLTNEGVLPVVVALKEGKTDVAPQLMKQLQLLVPPVTEGINTLRKIQVDEAKAEYEQSSARYTLLRNIIFGAIALGMIIAALLGTLLIRHIYQQLGGEPEYAAHIVHTIAGGDLTAAVTIENNDKKSLLFAMQTMQQNLAQTVEEIRQSTDTIATASSQIAAGNMDLSSRTEEQASSLEETASAMEQLTSTVKQNADNAGQANQLVVAASDYAVKGQVVVGQVVDTMGSIKESSRKIADIIGVIDGIAFQTNILALNAAVEAARAGEQGRGFAVVATEVRNLAQRAASAAKEIKTLIDDSVEKVDAGGKLADSAGATMIQIVTSVQQVADIMGEIASASREQSDGIEQVNQAVMQMDETTQQNAALVEQAAAAAASLQNQATNLAETVSVFKLSRDISFTGKAQVSLLISPAAKKQHSPHHFE
jgi:methyl-accepting chemotaxis protein